MKRLSIVFVCLLAGISLSACGGPANEDQAILLNENLNAKASPPSEMQLETTPVSELNQPESVKGVATTTQPPITTPPRKAGMKTLTDFTPIEGTEVTLTTNKGIITLELFRDQAPLTTLNFLTLIKDGVYDGIVFHRVIPDFMAQFGDPLSKDPSKQAMWGTGGPGYTIADEFSPELKHDSEGILSMANSGPNTGGSQVFITYGPTPHLDGKHAVFGKVTSGMDVLRQITNGDTIISATFK